MHSRRTSGWKRQLRVVQPDEATNPGKPATGTLRQGDRQGPPIPRWNARDLPRPTMPRPLRSERGNRGSKKGRLNPLGGRPVETWTRQAPRPRAQGRTKAEAADI